MSEPVQLPRRQEERRLVTCLFVDIVGSTPLTVALGPERLKRALDEAFAALREIIVAEGGTVEKYVGDAVYALFGAPIAHHDDPLRALRAADAAARWAATGSGELRFELRLGIETGEAIVDLAAAERSHQQMSVGAVVNTAARLQQRAEPGEVLVGPVCHDATQDAAEFAAIGTVPLKGIGDLPVWRFLGLGAAAAEAPALPFVGRDSELSLLGFALGRARAGRSVLAVVAGPPGQGKTALVREFLRRTGLGERTVLARCRPGGEGGVLTPLRQLLGLGEAGGLAELRADLAGRFSDPRERDRVAAALAQSAGIAVSPELTRLGAVELADELVNGWWRYLATQTGEEPAVLWVEDLHWADASVVTLIDRLTRGGERLLLLATARPEFAESAGLRPSGDRFFIELEGLEPGAAAALGASAGTLGGMALERAAGNPLFIVALARSGTADGDLPLTLRGALGERLDELDQSSREILGHAAIVGETFTAADAALLSGRAVAEISPALARLSDRHYLVAVGGAYRFHHSLLRDVAYGRLLAAERMRLHAAYAREGAHPEDAETLARHWGEALRAPDAEWVWSGSPELPAMRRSAFAAHLAAGRLHTEHLLIDPALELLARAADYADTPADSALAERALGAAYYRILRCDEAWDHLQRALAIHRSAGSVPLPLYLELLDVARKWGAFREPPERGAVEALIDEAEAAARAAGDRPALIRILTARVAFDAEGFDADPQDAALPEARALAEAAGEPDLLAGVLAFEIMRRGSGGDIGAIASALADLDKLIEGGAVLDRGDPTLPFALRSWAALLGGDLDRADALAAVAIDRVTLLGPHLRTHLAGVKSDVLLAAGRWRELLDLAEWTRQIVLAHPDSAFCVAAASILGYAACVHALEGRHDEARSALAPTATMTLGKLGPFILALPTAFLGERVELARTEFPLLDPWLQQVHRTWIALAQNDEAAARTALDELEAGSRGGSVVLNAFVTAARAQLAGEPVESAHAELVRLGYRGWSRFLSARAPAR